jgi:hypothetical protein
MSLARGVGFDSYPHILGVITRLLDLPIKFTSTELPFSIILYKPNIIENINLLT